MKNKPLGYMVVLTLLILLQTSWPAVAEEEQRIAFAAEQAQLWRAFGLGEEYDPRVHYFHWQRMSERSIRLTPNHNSFGALGASLDFTVDAEMLPPIWDSFVRENELLLQARGYQVAECIVQAVTLTFGEHHYFGFLFRHVWYSRSGERRESSVFVSYGVSHHVGDAIKKTKLAAANFRAFVLAMPPSVLTGDLPLDVGMPRVDELGRPIELLIETWYVLRDVGSYLFYIGNPPDGGGT